ncbi:hypothetical protein [Prevotella sp. E2-28]|uniref:hypothetical protein n=1 Tax=Prevotella sp. E2-28 TaxID=2913620 RepID=UPI001EDAF9D5|nr:hypothetical protein [Prevotella sp. E2-28]UKK52699.1 hypothetical protein L6465_08785 [Prevotella sp. E2-28]
MDTKIKRNDFVQPGLSRKEYVQDICDAVLIAIEKDGYSSIQLGDGLYPHLYIGTYVGNCCGRRKIIKPIDNLSYYNFSEQIRSCEMRLSFRILQEAGYYIYKSSPYQYHITNKPYMCGTMKAEYQDFAWFID